MLRSYDAAKTFGTDDWQSASRSNPNADIEVAQATVRDRARASYRNIPYSNKAVNVLVGNVVGSGIVPKIEGRTASQTKKLRELWAQWGETSQCDANGQMDFYGMQAQVMKTVFIDGDILAMDEDSGDGFKIRLLENDYLDTSKDSSSIRKGIEVDRLLRPIAYHVHSTHPSDRIGITPSRRVPAEQVSNVFRNDHPGQLRGISGFHSVLRQIEDLDAYQNATLIRQKMTAMFAAVIEPGDDEDSLTEAQKTARREADSALIPGTFRYLNRGEKLNLVNPPAPSGYSDYVRSALRCIAGGFGITYEALTGDYTQVNFSSGRLGHLEFRKNVEIWQWSVIIPKFCKPKFELFKRWAQFKYGIPSEDINAEWVTPTWSMIDPNKEYSAMQLAVRSGFMSLSNAIRQQGYDPESVFKDISETNKQLDDLGIVLDSDPRKITQAGQVQAAADTGDSEEVEEKPVGDQESE
jgi:lambda family phage portal protein